MKYLLLAAILFPLSLFSQSYAVSSGDASFSRAQPAGTGQ
jgi:hypothetical protein